MSAEPSPSCCSGSNCEETPKCVSLMLSSPPTQSQLLRFYFPFLRNNIKFPVLTRRKVSQPCKGSPSLPVTSPFPSAWVSCFLGDPHIRCMHSENDPLNRSGWHTPADMPRWVLVGMKKDINWETKLEDEERSLLLEAWKYNCWMETWVIFRVENCKIVAKTP